MIKNSEILKYKLERREVEQAVANFLKERDENVLPSEVDDEERAATASCIVTIMEKVKSQQRGNTEA